MLGLSLFVLAVFPARQDRTAATDAIEFALVTLLIVMFSPLSFNYAYVWLIYPITVALHLVLDKPAPRPLAEARARLDRRRPPHPRPGHLRAPLRPGLRQPVRPGAPAGLRAGAEARRDARTAEADTMAAPAGLPVARRDVAAA